MSYRRNRRSPRGERGLKCLNSGITSSNITVAPLAGAWIEIINVPVATPNVLIVAPLAGAWIEIGDGGKILVEQGKSLPSRERGLKLNTLLLYIQNRSVAPLAGAWIEI